MDAETEENVWEYVESMLENCEDGGLNPAEINEQLQMFMDDDEMTTAQLKAFLNRKVADGILAKTGNSFALVED
jgi:hypothetical protein